MRKVLLYVFLIILIIVNIYFLVVTINQKSRIDHLLSNFENSVRNSITEIEKTGNTKLEEIIQKGENQLYKKSEEISNDKIKKYKNELNQITKEIEIEKEKYYSLKEKRERYERGLPELVDLDQLYEKYHKNYYQAFTPLETFKTSKGEISFYPNEFEFAVIPSDKKLAWLKIGKENSTINSELIKTWLEEATNAKKKMGYKLVYNVSNPTDYGNYTEKLYKKGDMYFKTYYQYDRVQGTYNRYSLQYNFFVEIGSYKRKERYKLEQYNSTVGS